MGEGVGTRRWGWGGGGGRSRRTGWTMVNGGVCPSQKDVCSDPSHVPA
jgi:hypothetical protein